MAVKGAVHNTMEVPEAPYNNVHQTRDRVNFLGQI